MGVKFPSVRNLPLRPGDAASEKAKDTGSTRILLGLAAIGWLAIFVCVFA